MSVIRSGKSEDCLYFDQAKKTVLGSVEIQLRAES